MTGNILIVARNNLHLTKRAVRSSLAQDVPVDILVLDNASLMDSTSQWLRSKKEITTLSLRDQLSLGACWNLGIKSFFGASGGDFDDQVLVLNNDVEIRTDMYRLLRGTQLDFVTGVSTDDKGHPKYTLPLTSELAVELMSPHPDFSGFMISRRCWEKVGPFDEDYFPAYAEDSSYHVRMHRAGVRAYSVPVPFYHERSSTMKNCDAKERRRIEDGAERNRERFQAQYGCRPGTPEYNKLFEV
jgi:GT2 family glycosyltransferase